MGTTYSYYDSSIDSSSSDSDSDTYSENHSCVNVSDVTKTKETHAHPVNTIPPCTHGTHFCGESHPPTLSHVDASNSCPNTTNTTNTTNTKVSESGMQRPDHTEATAQNIIHTTSPRTPTERPSIVSLSSCSTDLSISEPSSPNSTDTDNSEGEPHREDEGILPSHPQDILNNRNCIHRCWSDWPCPKDTWVSCNLNMTELLQLIFGHDNRPGAYVNTVDLSSLEIGGEKYKGIVHSSGGLRETNAPRPPPSPPSLQSLSDSAELNIVHDVGTHLNHQLPTSIDMRHMCPPVYDDQNVACNSVSAAACLYEYHLRNHCKPNHDFHSDTAGMNVTMVPSRMFWYYTMREMSGMLGTDAGGSLRQAFNVLPFTGVCEEEAHPFNPAMIDVPPSLEAYERAWNYPMVQSLRVPPTIDSIRLMVASGYPVACSIPVYSSFEYDSVWHTGYIPTPTERDFLIGGHALVVVGYDDKRSQLVVRNSWGTQWGHSGYGYLPYETVCRGMVGSFWIVTETRRYKDE